MKKRAFSEDPGKSLKTFFLFSLIVGLLIVVSLIGKMWFMIAQSKYDAAHNFTVAVARDNKIQQIIGFNPSAGSVSILKIEGKGVDMATVTKELAVSPEGRINSSLDLAGRARAADIMSAVFLNYPTLKTDMTLFDIGRLFFMANSVSAVNTEQQKIVLPVTDSQVDKIVKKLFTDDVLVSENVSVQIVNASDIPGMGKRFERVLSNIGSNVVSVTTSRNVEKSSRVEYAGEKSYTLEKISKLFKLPVHKTDKDLIANIVIIIGQDSEKARAF